jgi:CheY-like chemotaxis protein
VFKTLLVVDDVGINLLLPGLILRPLGWTVHEVDTGTEALERLATCTVAYVLLDLNLPDINGTDVLSHLKTMPHLLETKVIAYTAYASSLDFERLVSVGFDAVLPKPIDSKTIIELLK